MTQFDSGSIWQRTPARRSPDRPAPLDDPELGLGPPGSRRSELPDQEEELGFGGHVWDGVRGVGAGITGFFQSIGKLGDDIVEVFGGDLADDELFTKPVIETKSWVGGLTSGLTQFALGFIPALGLISKAGKVGQALNAAGRAGSVVKGMAAGAVADFVAFQEHEARLSNLIEEFPSLSNPVSEYLAAKPDDQWAEGRLKNALEGLMLGAVAEPVIAGIAGIFRGFKGARIAAEVGDAEGVRISAEQIEQAVRQLEGDSAAAGAAVDSVDGAAAEAVAEAAKPKSRLLQTPDELKSELKARVQQNVESGFDVDDAFEEAVQTHVNYARKKLDKDPLAILKTVVEVMDETTMRDRGGVQSMKRVAEAARRRAEALGQDPDVLVKMVTTAENVRGIGKELVAYDIVENSVAKNLADLGRQLIDNPGNVELEQAFDDAMEFAIHVRRSVSLIQAETARAVTFGRIKHSTQELTNIRKALDALKDVRAGRMGTVERDRFLNTMAGNGGDPHFLNKVLDTYTALGDKAFKKFLSVHNEFWINGLLSGPHTQMVNVLSNMLMTAVLPAERIVGGFFTANFEMMKSGGRVYYNLVREALDIFGLLRSGMNATESSALGASAKAFLKHQPMLDGLTKDDRAMHAITSGNLVPDKITEHFKPAAWAVDFIGGMIRLPTRFMTGTDEFFKQINYRAYLRDEAMREASRRSLTGDRLTEFVERYVADAFDPSGTGTNKNALEMARKATFTQELRKGTLGRGIQDIVNKHPGMRLIMPFVRVPTNIFRTTWAMTPGLNLLQREFVGDLFSGDAVRMASASGRLALSMSFWTAAASLAMSGRITGGGPSNKAERDLWFSTGWRPYSLVLTGDDGKKEYISFHRFEPFSSILGLAADYSEAHAGMPDGTDGEIASAMLMSLAKNITGKTYLTGVSELLEAVTQPDRHAKRWIENRIGSYVPNVLPRTGDDDTMRETRTMLDAVRRRLPGLSETLPPRRNIFGEIIKVPDGYMPFGTGTDLARMVSPAAYSKHVGDPVKDELASLAESINLPSKTYRGVNLQAFTNEKGQDAYDRYMELHGQVKLNGLSMMQSLEKLITSSKYKSLVREDRAGEVRKVIGKYRQAARDQMLREYKQISDVVDQSKRHRSGGARFDGLSYLRS